ICFGFGSLDFGFLYLLFVSDLVLWISDFCICYLFRIWFFGFRIFVFVICFGFGSLDFGFRL
ncbi:MAG: hypothetical protein V1781_02565, partial [Bacteroidota bacterium]